MDLNKEELEAVIDFIDAGLKSMKLGRGATNKLRAAQYKMMIEAKLIIFKEGMNQNEGRKASV